MNVNRRESVQERMACLFASRTLETFCLGFLLAGAEGLEQIFLLDFSIGGAPFFGHHFLVAVRVYGTRENENGKTVPRLSFC